MKTLTSIVEGILSPEYDLNLLQLDWQERVDRGKHVNVQDEISKSTHISFLNVWAQVTIGKDLGDTKAEYWSHVMGGGIGMANGENIGEYKQPVIDALEAVLDALPAKSKPREEFSHDTWMKAEIRYENKRKQLVPEWCLVGVQPHNGKFMSLFEHGRLIKTNLKKVDVNIIRPILEQMLDKIKEID